MNTEIFRLHAEICKTLSHAKRLEILSILRDGEMVASEIVKTMKISKANVSQHLAVMRKSGIVTARREGINMYYRISNAKVSKACDLMKEVLLEQHVQKDKLLRKFNERKTA